MCLSRGVCFVGPMSSKDGGDGSGHCWEAESAKIKHTGSMSNVGSDCGSDAHCMSLVQSLLLSEL